MNPPDSDNTHPTAPPRRHVLRNVTFTVLSKMQGAVFSYIVIRILLKTLTVEQYGLHSLLFIGIMINLAMLFQLGIPNVLNRFVPEYYRASRFSLIHTLFRTVFRMQFGAAILAAGAVLLMAPRIAVWINHPDSTTVIRIFTVGAVCYLLSSQFQMLFGATFRQRTVFWVMLLYNVIRLAALFAVIQIYGSFLSIVIAEVIVLAGMLAFYWIAYSRGSLPLEKSVPAETEPPPWKPIRKYGAQSYVNEIGVSLLSVATDLLLITGIAGGLAAGYYALANRINHLVLRLLPDQLLAPVTQPLFFSEYGSSRESAGFGFTLLTKATLLIALVVSIWLALMARPVIVHLFDPRYAQEAAKLVAVMAIFIPVASMRLPLGIMLQNAKRVDLLIYAKVTALFKIAFGLWLLPRYGVIAMVWITGLAVLTQNLILYYFIVSRLGHRGHPSGIARIILNGLIAAAIFYFLRSYFSGVVGVILSFFVFLVIYLSINILHKSFRPEERDFINRHLSYPLWRF